MALDPFVRHLLICQDVQTDPSTPGQVDVIGFLTNLRRPPDVTFPYTPSTLCIYAALSAVRSAGRARIAITEANTNELCYASSTHPIPVARSPLDVVSLIFRLRDCSFTNAGLYWVELLYNDTLIATQPLLVR